MSDNQNFEELITKATIAFKKVRAQLPKGIILDDNQINKLIKLYKQGDTEASITLKRISYVAIMNGILSEMEALRESRSPYPTDRIYEQKVQKITDTFKTYNDDITESFALDNYVMRMIDKRIENSRYITRFYDRMGYFAAMKIRGLFLDIDVSDL